MMIELKPDYIKNISEHHTKLWVFSKNVGDIAFYENYYKNYQVVCSHHVVCSHYIDPLCVYS